ncbi:serine hydrolase domain-containing protein [soil metagenome]
MVLRALLAALVLSTAAVPSNAQQPTDAAARVDEVFREWNSTTSPGCAVEAAIGGRSVASRAYGMSDLEHGIRNSPATIFEAGSVSKQFTAAAIVLLALDGKLSLDDDVRRFVPEIPDYGHTITLRHLLTHTSGLRDWGSVASITGWGRSNRTHDHEHVVDILSRQRALNYTPGERYSYTNSGYNLLAVIVDRVSGMSFAEFSKQRIFEPLGLTDTQWRVDYRRIVPGRSSAYASRGDTFIIDRPIENVHGNGGLLTTVGDLVKWSRALATGELGGQRFVEMMHQQGVLNSGETITYASGLTVGRYHNLPEVSHTGATSGYRAFLARYPDQDLDVAVLCNIGSVNPGSVGHAVADILLGNALQRVASPARQQNAGADRPQPLQPTAAQLAEYAGEYYSPDVEMSLVVTVEDGELHVFRRPASDMVLRPTAADTFTGQLGMVRFIRGADGRVAEMSVSISRVDDLRFDRVR